MSRIVFVAAAMVAAMAVPAAANESADPEQLVADAEWLGTRMENEIENVRRDERRQFERDFDRRRGPSVGVGIGF